MAVKKKVEVLNLLADLVLLALFISQDAMFFLLLSLILSSSPGQYLADRFTHGVTNSPFSALYQIGFLVLKKKVLALSELLSFFVLLCLL